MGDKGEGPSAKSSRRGMIVLGLVTFGAVCLGASVALAGVLIVLDEHETVGNGLAFIHFGCVFAISSLFIGYSIGRVLGTWGIQ